VCLDRPDPEVLEMTMKNRKWCTSALPVAALLALSTVAGGLAQDAKTGAGGKAGLQEKVAELKQSLAANQKALQPYTWVETTEISMKGEVKKIQRKQCRYGADGKAMKTDLPDTAPAAANDSGSGGRRGRRGGGAVKKKVIDNKVEDLKEYMGDLAALVKQYVPPDAAKVQASAQAGKAALDKESTPGIVQLSIADYDLPGDKLAIAFNAAAKQLAGVNVNSYLGKEKDTVTLAVRFASLPDGVNYPAETILVAKAKQIQVKITNSGYKK
jgi:hypothetical protein